MKVKVVKVESCTLLCIPIPQAPAAAYPFLSMFTSWDANSTNTNTIKNTNTNISTITITNTDEQSWNIDISIRSSSWCSRQSIIAGMQILRTGRVQTWYWSTPSLLQMITISLSRWSQLLCHTSDDHNDWSLIGRCLTYQMITLCLSSQFYQLCSDQCGQNQFCSDHCGQNQMWPHLRLSPHLTVKLSCC